MDRFDTGADFTGQGFRRLRADHVFHENRPHVVGPAIVGQAGQLAGTGLAAGKDGFDAVLGQAEVAAEVGKGCMACDEILAGDAGEFAGIFILQGLELLFVVPGIVAVIVGVGRIGFSQGGGDIGNFYLGVYQTQPDVRVISAVLLDVFFIGQGNRRDTLGRIDRVECRILGGLDDFGSPRFHAQTAVNEELGFAEVFNGLRRRLKFMGFCPIGDECVDIDFIAAYGLGKFFQGVESDSDF